MIGLKQRDMENIVDFELGWKLQLANHETNQFGDFERFEAFVIQLGTWASGSNVFSEKPDLVSNLEVWMVLASAVACFFCHSCVSLSFAIRLC